MLCDTAHRMLFVDNLLMLLSNFSTVAWRKEAGLITALPNKRPAWVTVTELSFSHELASSGLSRLLDTNGFRS